MENFDALETLRINRNEPFNLVICELGDYVVHHQWHSPSSWNIKKDFYQKEYTFNINTLNTHIKSDLINNMDHMHILGT